MRSATGSIRERSFKQGTKWQVTIELGKDDRGIRKRNSFMCDTREEAEILLHKKIAEVNEGTAVLNNSVKVKDFLDEWLAVYVKPNRSPSTYKQCKMVSEKYLIPCFGEYRLQDLKPNIIQKHYNQWQQCSLYSDKPLKGDTVRMIHRSFRSAMGVAVELELIKSNPLCKVRLPKKEKQDKDFFSQEEITEILEAAKGTEDYLFLMVCFSTGGRRGEITALKWKNVDWVNKTIHIEKSFVEGVREVVYKDPKSTSSIRTIPLPDYVMKELKLGYMHYKEKKIAFGKGFHDDGFIFCKENGEPYKPSTIAQRYDRFLKRNGFRHIKFHNTRVSLASILAFNGVSPKTIQYILGHSSLEMTLNVYAQRVSSEMQLVSSLMDDKVFSKIGKGEGLSRVG